MRETVKLSKGTAAGMQYTREEGVSLLSEFQNDIIRDYKKRFNETLYDRRYFYRNLESTADGYGLAAEHDFILLRSHMKKIGEIIATWKSGLTGEERARHALSRTLPGEEMETLYNVTLSDGKERTEYDAVTITPYGVFAIEVKSYSQDMTWDEKGVIYPSYNGSWHKNLGERMNCKEYLLRNRLKEFKDVPFYNILLIADNRVKITDNYRRIPISYNNTILSDIRSYSDGRRYIETEQIREIKRVLLEETEPVLVPCPVDCSKVAEEYSWFVRMCSRKENRSFWKKLRESIFNSPADGTAV